MMSRTTYPDMPAAPGSREIDEKALDREWFVRLLGILPQAAAAQASRSMSEPWRRYHADWHLGRMWRLHGEMTARRPGMAVWDRDIALAIAYHDAVYLPRQGAPANEYASAALFLEQASALGLDPRRTADISRWIIASADHLGLGAQLVDEADDPAGAWFLDLDLEPIASSAFGLNSVLLREEFSHVPDEAFEKGRQGFLDRLRAEAELYRSAPGRSMGWEALARQNLA